MYISNTDRVIYHYLTLSWPAGHICPTYKESFQVRWDNSIPLFSMLPSTLKYLYSVEPVRVHFPAKQPRTNDTVCNAAKTLCKWDILCPAGHERVKAGSLVEIYKS